jgi:hypothetical protein
MSSLSENLAQRAFNGMLTVEDVKRATKEKLVNNKCVGCTVLYWASGKYPAEVVEAILDKGVNINGVSRIVRIVVGGNNGY